MPRRGPLAAHFLTVARGAAIDDELTRELRGFVDGLKLFTKDAQGRLNFDRGGGDWDEESHPRDEQGRFTFSDAAGGALAAVGRGARAAARAALEVAPHAGRAVLTGARYLAATAAYETALATVASGLAIAGLVPGVRQSVIDSLKQGIGVSLVNSASRRQAERVSRRMRNDEPKQAPGGDIRKRNDHGAGWFVNQHGILFFVWGEDYFVIAEGAAPELEALPPGDYASDELAELIAGGVNGSKSLVYELGALLRALA